MRSAARHPLYARLDIADCATLSTAEDDVHLPTVDFDLDMAVSAAGRPVTNFRRVIDGQVRP